MRARHGGQWLDGVASYGRRPTFDNGRPLFEVHLFDFAGDLYGAELKVELAAYLRPELKFDGIAELIAQMHVDAAQARAVLSGAAGGPDRAPVRRSRKGSLTSRRRSGKSRRLAAP